MLKSRILGENPVQRGPPLPQDQAVRRTGAAGGRRLRDRDGALGHCRQGVRRSGLPDAGRQIPRPHPHLRGHHGVDATRKIYAQQNEIRKEEMGLTWLKMDLGIDLVSDKPGTVTCAFGLEQGRGDLSAPSLRRHRGHRQGHRDDVEDTWPRCARPWAWRFLSPWITSATSV